MAERRRQAAVAGVVVIIYRRKGRRRMKAVREKEWLRRRTEKSTFHGLLEKLRLEDPESYRRYLRMDTATFEVITFIAYVFRHDF